MGHWVVFSGCIAELEATLSPMRVSTRTVAICHARCWTGPDAGLSTPHGSV
jgi:hypothetical protein